MPDILVKKTRAEPGEASLEVSIPPDNVRAAEERATKVYQQRARLPGFRQGKAPAAVVRKKFADDIRQETLRELVQESWRVAQKQEELKPIADPHIHNLKWEEGAPVTFEFHVELKPELKLQRLGGFRLTRTVPAVTAAQVDAQLTTMREQRAPWTPVAGEKPQLKDLVDVIIATRENGAEKDPQPYQFVLGELVGLRVLLRAVFSRRDDDVDEVLELRLLARDRGPRGALFAHRGELCIDLGGRHRRHRPRQTEAAEALQLQLRLQLDVEFERDGSAFFPFQIVDVGIGDGLELFLLLRDAPALLHQLAQRFLPDVIGEFLAHHRGGGLALPEAGQAGALLVGPGGTVLGRLHIVGRNGDLEGGFARFRSGLLYKNLGHVGNKSNY